MDTLDKITTAILGIMAVAAIAMGIHMIYMVLTQS